MSTLLAKTSANGHAAIGNIRSSATRIRARAIPQAANAAETAGEAVSKFALSTSKSVAGALRKRQPSTATGLAALLGSSTLLRTAGRFALRNPALLAAAGVAVAALSYAAWRRQRATEAPAPAE